MSDLISRQAAIDAIKSEKVEVFHELYDEAWNDALNGCIDVIEQLPPIQPEIVMCKECKYHYQRNCPIEKYFSLDGFCSRGEKREVTT